MTSPAFDPAFEGAGKEVGIQIWRIVNLQVTHWDKDRYGEFFNGDSYIILNTYKEKPTSSELLYDLHFWIGTKSTQDEYGVAAYKTVELDGYLEDKPIQHREVQGFESKKFKSYFPKLIVKNGGADSGFKKVEKEKFVPRLLRFRGEKRKIEMTEVSCRRSNLDSDDVFILDLGDEIHQWNGKKANMNEKREASQYVQELKSERMGRAKTEIHDEIDMRPGDEFYDRSFPMTGPRDIPEDAKYDTTKRLFRVSDASGSATFKLEKEGKVTRADFDSEDVFVFDAGHTAYVFKGKNCSVTERLSGLTFGNDYLNKNGKKHVHICVVSEGKEKQADFFLESLDK